MRIQFLFLFFLTVIIEDSFVLCQNKGFEISNTKVSDYPYYKGDLLVRNPNRIDTSKVKFFSGEKMLELSFSNVERGDVISENKSVLFVVLNHQAHRDRTQWYQSVLESAVNKNMMKAGDEFALVSFDCNRPEYGAIKKQLLFPEQLNFTSGTQVFGSQIRAINSRKKSHKDNCQKIGDIYGAISEAIEIMDEMDTKNAKSIVILADDWSIPELNIDITGKARDANIPIYGITYFQNIKRDYGVEDICEKTFGEYAIDRKNRVDFMSDKLLEFMDTQIERASGLTYSFSFISPHNKDGKNHSVQVHYKALSNVATFQFSEPSYTFKDWINDNPVLFVVLTIALLAIIILIIILLKRRSSRRAELKILQDEELKRVHNKQLKADSKVAKQAKELENMKSEQQKREQEQKNAVNQKRISEENKVKLQAMSSRGNLPWFTYSFDGNEGSIEMNSPDFSFGRGEDLNFTLNNNTVSRSHFIVSFDNGTYTLQDLDSSNGTFLNGSKVSNAVLKHGDVISAGEIVLTFHI